MCTTSSGVADYVQPGSFGEFSDLIYWFGLNREKYMHMNSDPFLKVVLGREKHRFIFTLVVDPKCRVDDLMSRAQT